MCGGERLAVDASNNAARANGMPLRIEIFLSERQRQRLPLNFNFF
jgi:hypothetical protein